jgi:DNA-binding transcriptional regulator YhcF (GntR family)
MTKRWGGRRRQRPRPHVETWWSRPASLQTLPRGSLAERAADQLRHRIQLGDVQPGQRLESSRMLAKELGVSLPVVREALAALRAIGLVEIRHGIGASVARRHRAAPVLRASRRRATRRELNELRRGLDAVMAAVAARRVTPHRMREMRFALEERALASRSGDPQRFTSADLEPHRWVALARRERAGHEPASNGVRRPPVRARGQGAAPGGGSPPGRPPPRAGRRDRGGSSRRRNAGSGGHRVDRDGGPTAVALG